MERPMKSERVRNLSINLEYRIIRSNRETTKIDITESGVIVRTAYPIRRFQSGIKKTRWGSCSINGNLNFNCLLMLMPEEAIDVVFVHELCHLKEMNHSKTFYQEIYRDVSGI